MHNNYACIWTVHIYVDIERRLVVMIIIKDK